MERIADQVDAAAVDRAAATSVWLSFTADQAPPIHDSTPYLVADFEDSDARDSGRAWRIRTRHIRPVFRNPHGTPPRGGSS